MSSTELADKKYELFFIMDGGSAEIDRHGKVKLSVVDSLTADEMAFIGAVSGLLARLRNGKLVDYSPPLDSYEDEEQLVKCEWLRSGNLKVHGPTEIRFKFSDSVDKAVSQHRVFTCTRRTSKILPKNKINYKVSTGKSGAKDEQV